MDVADEYVWVYGEKFQFVRWKDGSVPAKSGKNVRWDDVLPGFDSTIAFLNDRESFGRRRVAELSAEGKLRNLAQNAACNGVGGKLPKPFGCWQPGKKDRHAGTFGSDQRTGDGDSSSLCAEGVPSGCFTLKIENIVPGGSYVVKCSAKGKGTSAMVTWTDGKRNWMDSVYVQDWEQSGEWRRGFITVRAPFTAKNLHLHLGVALAPGEKCWFDSIEIIPVD
jgi:hypothetical protein